MAPIQLCGGACAIGKRKVLDRRCWTMEDVMKRLNCFRLRVRYEQCADIYQAFLLLACALVIPGLLAFSVSIAFSQTAAQNVSFDVASVKASEHPVGPDYNNQLTVSPSGITAKHTTLKKLIAVAYHLQLTQIIGQNWLGQNEYDVQAQAGSSVSPEALAWMLRNLLAERFLLKQHSETRNMSMFELVIDKAGPKIQPVKADQEPVSGGASHFHGDMYQLADLIALQLTIPAPTDPTKPAIAGGSQIPVLNKTGLTGIYDFDLNVKPELGTDGFTTWQRILQNQLELRLNHRRGEVPVVVIEDALRIPTGN